MPHDGYTPVMLAYTIDAFKTPGTVHEIPPAEPQSDEIRVKVTAAGVNPIDWKIRDGANSDLPLPRVLGQDFAGVVDAIGTNVKRFAVGQRVFGCARSHGAFAEMTVIPVDHRDEPVSTIPDGVSDAIAAALPTPGLTALACLNAAGVTDGTAVLMLGAAGSVGSIATQLAAIRGASVTGTVKGSGADRVRKFGAQHVFDTGDVDEVIARTKAIYSNGVPVILDFVSNGEELKKLSSVLQPGGTLVTTIHVADEAWFSARGFKAINITLFETPESSPECLDQLTGLVRDGKLEVDIAQERPLRDARSVLDASEAHAIEGKVILRPA